jgi:hypothetical protein
VPRGPTRVPQEQKKRATGNSAHPQVELCEPTATML